MQAEKAGTNDTLAEAIQAHQQGNLDGALSLYQAVLQKNPDDTDALVFLGVIAYQKKQYKESEALFRKALSINNTLPVAWCNFGSLLQDTQRMEKAINAFKNAIELRPEFPEAYANLGNAYAALGELEKAVVAYQQALRQRPDYLDAELNLGISFREMGRFELAEQCFISAITKYPESAEAAHNLGSLYAEWGKNANAQSWFEKAIALKPDYAEAYSNLGALYLETGNQAKAMECFKKAPDFSPQYHIAESNKIFTMHYDSAITSQELYDAAIAWGKKYAPECDMRPPVSDKNPGRTLRVGYVSPDFRAHPVGIFMESVLANHTSDVEVFCYAGMPHEDYQTKRIRPSVKNWRRTFRQSDAELEKMIRDDKIDILIDMSGHTAAHRLKVFARKPAPVQITWLGYFDTTGMAAMDYILCDDKVLPAASEKWFVEKPLRMPGSYLCFTPPPYEIDVAPSPHKANGYVTFGCFNRINKFTPDTLACWSEILKAVPGSKLFLKSKSLAEEPIREGFCKIMADHGIDKDRLRFEGADMRKKYLATYNEVDIVLDPFPYGGGTTTAEALWMARPVVTWPQERFIGRISNSLIQNLGRSEWVAHYREAYVEVAVSLAKNLAELERAHQRTRQDFLNSEVCDAKHFVKNLERLYREAWKNFCNAKPHQ